MRFSYRDVVCFGYVLNRAVDVKMTKYPDISQGNHASWWHKVLQRDPVITRYSNIFLKTLTLDTKYRISAKFPSTIRLTMKMHSFKYHTAPTLWIAHIGQAIIILYRYDFSWDYWPTTYTDAKWLSLQVVMLWQHNENKHIVSKRYYID